MSSYHIFQVVFSILFSALSLGAFVGMAFNYFEKKFDKNS